MKTGKPTFFKNPEAFRAWLAKHHETSDELWVGYYKKQTGKPTLTWPESVDEALCYGWIDSIRKTIDDTSYTIRFTPRKAGSIWSAVNIKRAQALADAGRMRPSGLVAYQARRENKAGVYSYEQRSVGLVAPYDRLLKKNKAAWDFFQAQPASYKKAVSWWVVSAKKGETRVARLEKLMMHSGRGERLPAMAPNKPTRS